MLADPAEWTVDPWSGELRDGHVWGRGALDMKGQVAASAVAIASLAREGFRPRGDLIFAATADEEVGDDPDFGLSWLCREHPEAVRAEYAVNEGAGDRVVVGGRVFYLCAAAEKMSSPFVLRVHGRSGHASLPSIADNALVKAAGLIERLAEFDARAGADPGGGGVPRSGLRLGAGRPGDALEAARAVDPAAAVMIEALLSLTVSPTMITASQKRNVIPALTEVTVDCRLLPGQTQAGVEPMPAGVARRRRLRARLARGPGRHALGDGDAALVGGRSRSSPRSSPGARVAPICVAGFTDSHWLREAFGTVAYGFFPVKSMDPDLAARLVHSADERADVDDLELGVRFLRHAAQAIGTTG